MTAKDDKVDFLDKIAELYAWLEAVIASLIVGLIVASVIYFPKPNSFRLYLAIAALMLSLIIGGFLANKKRKEKLKIQQDLNQQ